MRSKKIKLSIDRAAPGPNAGPSPKPLTPQGSPRRPLRAAEEPAARWHPPAPQAAAAGGLGVVPWASCRAFHELSNGAFSGPIGHLAEKGAPSRSRTRDMLGARVMTCADVSSGTRSPGPSAVSKLGKFGPGDLPRHAHVVHVTPSTFEEAAAHPFSLPRPEHSTACHVGLTPVYVTIGTFGEAATLPLCLPRPEHSTVCLIV